MDEPRSAPYNTIAQGRVRLAELVASRGLLSLISKYTHRRAPNIQSTRQCDRSFQRQNKSRITYVLGMPNSHDKQ